MQVEKYISYQIERHFPALYRESGRELVDFVKSYYDFLERMPNQGTYNSRRLFEYRDIDNTLDQLLIFFKKKYLNDLPYDESSMRFIVKHVLDLYRRKGNKESIDLFFKMFYDEKVNVYYPSTAMLKPSDSKWETQKYLQLFPTSPFSLRDVAGKRIIGTISKAEAIVDNAFFILLNETMIPVLFINNVRGNFVSYDNILFKDVASRNIGVVYGSLTSAEVVDTNDLIPTTGNEVGDILTISNGSGVGGKLLVTEVSKTFSGEVRYTIAEGGWGYTKENTRLLVSNQVVILTSPHRTFSPFDTITDFLGNTGIVIGQKDNALGVRLPDGQEFSGTQPLYDSESNPVEYEQIVAKNDSSPGPLLPDAAPEELDYAVAVDELTNVSTISLITDAIENFVNVPLNAANYNTDPNATAQMSGVDPVNLTTPLNQAFVPVTYEVGTIASFKNINPGFDYINDVFAIAYDQSIVGLNRRNQIVTYSGLSSLFNIGDLITQGATTAKIVKVIENKLFVMPYDVTGIVAGSTFNHRGANYSIISVVSDFSSPIAGNNAEILSRTEFAVGRITKVKVVDSGFGHVNDEIVFLRDEEGNDAVAARLSVKGSGETEGSWKTHTSHIGVEYGKVIQDSFYYQDYSYEIQSNLDINTYERAFKDIVHVAGTKLFGKFNYEDAVSLDSRMTLVLEELRIEEE